MRHHQQFKMATDKDLKAKAKMAIYIRPKLLHLAISSYFIITVYYLAFPHTFAFIIIVIIIIIIIIIID